MHRDLDGYDGREVAPHSQFFGALDRPFDKTRGSGSKVAADLGRVLDRDMGGVADRVLIRGEERGLAPNSFRVLSLGGQAAQAQNSRSSAHCASPAFR